MIKISVPIMLPFGFSGDIDNLSTNCFRIEINRFRDLPKHSGVSLEYEISLVKGVQNLTKFGMVNHDGIQIPGGLINYYVIGLEDIKKCFTVNIIIHTDLEAISKEYSAPGEIYRDVIISLCLFLHGCFNTSGYARFSPVILINDKELMFNSRLAYWINPGQYWFCSARWLAIILNSGLKEQIRSRAKYYDAMLPHVKKAIMPLNLDDVFRLNEYPPSTIDHIFNFGRVLSEIIRLHPSYDYSAIVALLTALIEGLLKINGENRYKFKIKVSNLLKDPNLGRALNEIYDSRSAFFHTAKYDRLNDVFESLTIEFLLVVIKKIIYSSISSNLEIDSFDF